MYQEKMREATASCLLAVAVSKSSLDQMQTQPPSRFPTAWATARRTAAATPNLKASWLGSRHSNIHTFKCFTCISMIELGIITCGQRRTQPLSKGKRYRYGQITLFCAISASIPSIPATTSMAIISRQTKNPTFFAIYCDSLETLKEVISVSTRKGGRKTSCRRDYGYD